MIPLSRSLPLLAAFAALISSPTALSAAIGEVTLSGSTWTGKVDGVTKYTGTSMSAAAYACSSVMGGGTIQIKNSGSTGEIRASAAKRLKKVSSGPNMIEGRNMVAAGTASSTACSPRALVCA